MGFITGIIGKLQELATSGIWGAALSIVATIVSIIGYLLFKRWKKQEDLEKEAIKQDQEHKDVVQEQVTTQPNINEGIKHESDALADWENKKPN